MDMAIWNQGLGIYDIKSVIQDTFIGYSYYNSYTSMGAQNWVRKQLFWRPSLESSSTAKEQL